MERHEPGLSISTLIEVSGLIGFPFGKNSTIRDLQDEQLVLSLQDKSNLEIKSPDHKKSFYLAAIDFLVYKENNTNKFYFLEINGSGIGSVTNMTYKAFNSVLNTLSEIPEYLNDCTPLILMAHSDSQSVDNSLPRRFIYEKFFYIEAIKQSLINKYGSYEVLTLPDILKKQGFNATKPAIVIGFINDFLKNLTINDHELSLFNNPVSALYNDVFCYKLLKTSPAFMSSDSVYTINDIYPAIISKARTYNIYNNFIDKNKYPVINKTVGFTLANNKDELITAISNAINQGKRVVIKPDGGCVGIGIEFFLNNLNHESILNLVNKSIADSLHGLDNESFLYPYTISDYQESKTIESPGHEFSGHKYDLRIVLYREGNTIKAFPSVARLAGTTYNPDKPEKSMLVSYASLADSTIKQPKYKYSMPLSNTQTLETLEISMEELEQLCHFSTHFVNFVIENYKNYD